MIYTDLDALYSQAGLLYNDGTASRAESEPSTGAAYPNANGDSSRLRLFLTHNGANEVSLIDPAKLFEQCRSQNMPVDSWLGKANSYTCPLGSEPGIAYLLVRYDETIKPLHDAMVQAQSTSPGLQYKPVLSMAVVDVAGNSRSIWWMPVVGWRCVTPGRPDDSAAVYMLTLKDHRASSPIGGLAWDQHAAATVSTGTGGPWAFNIPKTVHHGGNTATGGAKRVFLPSTVKTNVGDPPAGNGGSAISDTDVASPNPAVPGTTTSQTLWSWAEMLTQLGLRSMLNQAADPVTLPYTPATPPVDFDFQGVPYSLAVAAVLDRLSMALSVNPFHLEAVSSTFVAVPKLVVIGTPDPNRDAALNSIRDYLVWDAAPADICAADVITAGFRSKVFTVEQGTLVGTYVTSGVIVAGVFVPTTSQLWLFKSDWTAERTQQAFSGPAEAALPSVGSVVWGGYIADHDVPTFVGVATLPWTTANALQSAAEHRQYLKRSILSDRQLNRIYAGFHTMDGLMPGSMMKVVRWEDVGHGPRTHVYCGDGYLPPHALYHLVNPHRFHRTDGLRTFRSIESLDLSAL